ncbi:MAG: DNA repair protein RadA [Proteobacteria bacterium]|nr:DNA repair protein RadA [Pseudomonadota bacterium]
MKFKFYLLKKSKSTYTIPMKQIIDFVCQNCGYKSPKWIGKCPDCGSWNSFVEEVSRSHKSNKRDRDILEPLKISEVDLRDIRRIKTSILEFDRVLGGGIVPASMILIGGEPGIGKSTLITQVANIIANQGLKVLYLTAEESLQQVRIRAERLGTLSDNFYIIAENSLENLLRILNKTNPDLLIIDSIQTIFSEDIPSAQGSVSQVRECASKLMDIAKRNNITVFVVGHVTKEGIIAGPRVLEHLVDTVIYFEGDRGLNFRILRSVKNRFGSTNEVGIFEMSESGLKEIRNLSEYLIGDRVSDEPGSATFVAIEGTRPIIVEIQALVTNSNLAMPRRISMGIEGQRLNILVAVLEKKLGLPLYANDIFLNIAGGLKLTETASDLAVCLAIISSYKNLVLPKDMIFLGEVGLLGELRPVSQVNLRLKEAKNLNFKKALLSANQKYNEDFDIMYAKTLEEAVEACFLK